MKTFKIYSAIMLLIAAFAISCSKDDEKTPTAPVFLQEDPYPAMIADCGYTQGSITDLVSSAEVGYSFTPLVNGKINSLKVTLPTPNANTRVTLWDVETQQPIQTLYVNVPTAATPVVKIITPIALVKDKKYALSFFNGTKYYVHSKPGITDVPFPRTYGNIRVDDIISVYTNGFQTYPTGDGMSYSCLGDISMNFQRTL